MTPVPTLLSTTSSVRVPWPLTMVRKGGTVQVKYPVPKGTVQAKVKLLTGEEPTQPTCDGPLIVGVRKATVLDTSLSAVEQSAGEQPLIVQFASINSGI